MSTLPITGSVIVRTKKWPYCERVNGTVLSFGEEDEVCSVVIDLEGVGEVVVRADDVLAPKLSGLPDPRLGRCSECDECAWLGSDRVCEPCRELEYSAISAGLCRVCRAPAVPSSSRCEEHLGQDFHRAVVRLRRSVTKKGD